MKRNIKAHIKAIKHTVREKVSGATKAVKREWVRFQLQQLIDQQATIDTLMWEKTVELNQLARLHDAATNELAAKRTAMRTKLLRLEY